MVSLMPRASGRKHYLWTAFGPTQSGQSSALGGEGHPNPTLAFPMWEAEGVKALLCPSLGAEQQWICYNSFPLPAPNPITSTGREDASLKGASSLHGRHGCHG